MTHSRLNIMRQCYESMLELVRPDHENPTNHQIESDTDSRIGVEEMDFADELCSGSEANQSGNSSDEDCNPLTSRARATLGVPGKKRRWALTTTTTNKKNLYSAPKLVKSNNGSFNNQNSSTNHRKFARRAVLGTGQKV